MDEIYTGVVSKIKKLLLVENAGKKTFLLPLTVGQVQMKH